VAPDQRDRLGHGAYRKFTVTQALEMVVTRTRATRAARYELIRHQVERSGRDIWGGVTAQLNDKNRVSHEQTSL
jgi:hypothetical protein